MPPIASNTDNGFRTIDNDLYGLLFRSITYSMSWYGANNYGNNFGSNSFTNGDDYGHTTSNISNDNNIYDPFPPSQREYTWGSTDYIRPQPEPENRLRTEHTEYAAEYIVPRTRVPQHQQNQIHWITGSDNNNNDDGYGDRPPVPQRPAVPRRSSTVVLGKRKAATNRQTASSAVTNLSHEDALRQKRQKFLEMDDWTGVKKLAAAARPLEIQFPQYNKEEPVWGWGEGRPPYPPPQPSQRSRSSQHRMSQRLPLSDAYSVKKVYEYGQATSSRTPSQLYSAASIDKGKGRASSVATGRESFLEPPRIRHSGNTISEHSPYVLAPASSSSFGFEPPSAQSHAVPNHHIPHSYDRPPSSVHHSLPQRPTLEVTSPYFVGVQPSSPSHSNRITTPSFASTGRRSVVSGTLSEVEQQRFEDDGLAILSPTEPRRPHPVQSSPFIAVPSSPARESTPQSIRQTPEIEQTPESRQPGSRVSEVVVEEESSGEGDIGQHCSNPEDVDRESSDHEDAEQGEVDDEVDQVVERESTPKGMPIRFNLLHQPVDYSAHEPESPQVECTSVAPKGSKTAHIESQPEAAIHEDGLFEANRVNIRAIPDWDGGEDDIEDSDESERERQAATARKMSIKAARKHNFRRLNTRSRRE